MAIGTTDKDCAVAVGELFAVTAADVDSSDDDAAAVWLWLDAVFDCFEPVLAPPVLTALPDPAVADRFDDAVPWDELLEPALDELVAEEFPPAAEDPVDVSAHATPYPVENNAAPTPRATANPPTRPTKREAPMIVYLPDQRPLCLCGG
ncbi:hypothetical protein [Mycolicibacterium sphagni]|uniref:Uncharacterized protein n=1 Tax=Mycolicibacterium sphagni TaxID=1786 RepID=A0ABX2JSF8_9MYCO|nr:hypothetical protein [Mycolicibacterium sphagni]NTY59734.1 hypothetical protein [Mycolicibacterium sphagni]